MSSGNLIQIVYVPESEYGVTPSPLSGVTAETALFHSESLSGTPTTSESKRIRTDRMSAGMSAVGLEVGGTLEFELSEGTFFNDWLESAMMEDWVAAATISSTEVTLTPDGSDDQLATLTIDGDFSSITTVAGDLLQLVPSSGSPVNVQVISVTSTTEVEVATKRGQAAISAVTMDVERPALLTIGDTQHSFVGGKAYQDVLDSTDERSQTYNGLLVEGFTMNAQYGEFLEGSFTVNGNGYAQEGGPSLAQQIATAGGTVNGAGTSQPLNCSIDFPLVTTSGVATDFCIESVGLTFSNNLDPTNCIGKTAPTGYTLGTAQIGVSLSAYLSNTSYDALMANKLSLTPLEVMFAATNADGGFAFRITAAQLSFPDPSTSGQDTQTMIEAEGTGKVGTNGLSALIIYRLKGDQ
jgi:hypothetical protein